LRRIALPTVWRQDSSLRHRKKGSLCQLSSRLSAAACGLIIIGGQRRAGRAPPLQPGTTVPLKLAAISIRIRFLRVP